MTAPHAHPTILPEVWTLIGTHLPPHHLCKLLYTSKQIKAATDNEDYWTLVAAQLIWRDCEAMEIHPCGPCETDVMPRVDMDLYDIPRAPTDYRARTERFFARMEEMRATYTKGAQEMADKGNHACLFGNNEFHHSWWRHWFAQTLAARTANYFYTTAGFHNIRLSGDEFSISQKELARRKTLAIFAEIRAAGKAGEILQLYLKERKAKGPLQAHDIYGISRKFKRILREHEVPCGLHWKYWRQIRGGIVEGC